MADDFRDYMLLFLFLKYLSDKYIEAVKMNWEETISLSVWYEQNKDDVAEFEKQMRRKVHYISNQ